MGKDTFCVPKPGFNLHLGDTLAVKVTDHKERWKVEVYTSHNDDNFHNMNYPQSSSFKLILSIKVVLDCV